MLASAMKLADYMKLKELKPEAMAEIIGDASASGVKKWMRGERRPRPSQQQRIFEVTGGNVTPNDFVLRSNEVAA